jgi:hypothetical protein
MTEGGSVWDTGPQYPEMQPDTASGLPTPGVAEAQTPESGSPVDIGAPPPEPLAPASALQTPPPSRKGPPPPSWWQRALLGFPVWMLFAFIGVIVLVFVVIAKSGDPESDGLDRLETAQTAATTAPQSAAPATAAPTPSTAAVVTPAAAPTTPAPPTAPPTAPPATSAPVVPATTAAPALTAPPVTTAPAPTAPPATVPPSTAPPTTRPATLPPDGPVVTIIGQVAPCRFGSQCLLAGFTIHDFDSQPTEFVCEFADGSRYTFRFNRQEVERACATGDPTDSITIEVAGVRSATYRHP